jgi:protein TonB
LRPEDASQPIEAQVGAVTDAAAVPAASEGAPAPVEPPAVDAPAANQESAAPAGAGEATDRNLFGTLNADQRIRAVVKQNERTLWAGAAGVTLIYAAVIASQAMQFSAADLAEMMKRKRGQDAPDSISVELVPDPDQKAKTKKWQDGTAQQQSPEPQPQQPQQPQVANLPQPQAEEAPAKEEPKPKDQPKAEDEPKPDEDAPKAEQDKTFAPTLPDLDTLVDAAAADLDRKIKQALDKKQQQQRQRQQQRQAAAPGGALQLRGTGASGRSDPFSRSVIAALMKTRPGPFALWGRVLVSFQISEAGQVSYVHLLQSSGNSALDQAAINAIRKAQFERPPAGLSADERTYIIDYIFG